MFLKLLLSTFLLAHSLLPGAIQVTPDESPSVNVLVVFGDVPSCWSFFDMKEEWPPALPSQGERLVKWKLVEVTTGTVMMQEILKARNGCGISYVTIRPYQGYQLEVGWDGEDLVPLEPFSSKEGSWVLWRVAGGKPVIQALDCDAFRALFRRDDDLRGQEEEILPSC